jgi:chemosensory pili system protein ChpA (sensor histidine kinase/response regulator)
MLPEDQKRILGYFIEEAKDHLNTIEQGLLNLAATVGDHEMMNEVFRAAHSVKGGAAMLGLNSIQRTSHRMEDFFKVMKESPLRPDRELETMLLQIFDGLQEQLEQLQSPFGLTNDQAQEIMAPLEPIFEQAEAHLMALVGSAPSVAAPAAPPPAAATATAPHPETSALQLVFRSDVPVLLRDMLATFKQPDSPASRHELSRLCQQLYSLGEQFELDGWCELAQLTDRAIANPDQTYRTLAPVVIKDLKQAQDLILSGATDQVCVSPALQSLLPAEPEPAIASDDSTLDALLAEALSDDSPGVDLADLFATAEGEEEALGLEDEGAAWLDDLALAEADSLAETGLESVFGQLDTPLPAPPAGAGSIGPEVGAAELNSLADLFESNPNGMAEIWEEDDLPEVSLGDLGDGEALDDDFAAEFADLLIEEDRAAATQGLDDMASLFGYDLDTPASAEADPPNDPAPAAQGAHPEPLEPDLAAFEPLVDPFGEDEASAVAPAAATADALDDWLSEADAPPSPPVPDSAVEDFFAVEGTAADGREAVVDDVDHFFDELAAGEFVEDDDAYTMPELNLDLEVDGAPGSGSVLPPPLEPAPPQTDTAEVPSGEAPAGELSLASAPSVAPSTSGDTAFEADPFGELVMQESSVELATVDSPGAVSEAGPAIDANGLTDVFADADADLDWDDIPDFAALDSLVAEPGEAESSGSSLADLSDPLGGEDGIAVDSFAAGSIAPEQPTAPAKDVASPFGEAVSSLGLDLDSGLDFDNGLDDDFGDLEALLEDSPSANGFAAIAASPDSPAETLPNAPSLVNGDDEFDDLEKLLEEADQLGGSAPTLGGRRATAAQAARRSSRRAASSTDQTMRVSVGHLDTLSNLVGELVVNRNSLEQDQERLRQFLDNLLHQVGQLNDVGQRMRDLYERSLLESSLIANRQAFALGVSSDRSGSSHATGATFDALEMDRFTGFHTLSQEMIELIVRVREASSDIEFTIDSTDQIARQFRQVTTQLQEGLNKARMVPFGQTADRLPRAVRDISLKCGKEAQLIVEGRDTLIDKMILERLYDPMTHLVNNAITHGIESPEERLATGKPREGTITVRAFYQGNQTVIYIADNGGGINPAVVKAKALKQGLITPAEAQTMSEIEVYDLLFLPGFSTRDQADDFSGRGVGMDVVRTALADIRGSITIESEVGKGTSFTIRLPLTLSITKALSCVNNQARIAFPMDGVEDMFDVPKERIQTDDQGHSCILWRDTLLPFRPLGELLRFNRSLGRGRVYGGPQDEDVVSIVVLRSASTFIALQVDQVIGEQEIVIKQLEGPVPKPMGIAGATVLGDGRVMPIADVLELIDLASGRMRRDTATSLWTQTVDEEPEEIVTQAEPTVLIVDDSITVRELLSMSFNKVGYRVEQARDGQEAWEKLRSGLPCDLVFCDIEMPRMDGLELLSRMQKDELLSQIPIAMLTSRGADRHRQMAVDLGAKGYFTKPYLEEMLLDAAQRMLKGENMVPQKVE